MSLEQEETITSDVLPEAVLSTEVEESVDPSQGQSNEIPEKFRGKSTEDIVKAYTEAERSLRQAQEERANAQREAELLRQQQLLLLQQQSGKQTYQEPEDEAFLRDWTVDPAKATYEQLKRVEQKAIQTAQYQASMSALKAAELDRTNFPDFEKYKGTMARFAKDFGDVIEPSKRNDPKLIPLLYNLARAAHVNEELEVARKAGKDEASKKARERSASDSEGSSRTNANVSKSIEDMTLDELRKKIGYVKRD